MKRVVVSVPAFGVLVLLYVLSPTVGLAALSGGFAYALRRHLLVLRSARP